MVKEVIVDAYLGAREFLLGLVGHNVGAQMMAQTVEMPAPDAVEMPAAVTPVTSRAYSQFFQGSALGREVHPVYRGQGLFGN